MFSLNRGYTKHIYAKHCFILFQVIINESTDESWPTVKTGIIKHAKTTKRQQQKTIHFLPFFNK